MIKAVRIHPRRTVGVAVAVLMGMTVVTPIATRSAGGSSFWDPFFATASTAADLGAPRAYGVAAGDFNGDGNSDMIDGAVVAGKTVSFWASPQKGSGLSQVGTAVTNAQGLATLAIGTLNKGQLRTVEARFATDASYSAATSNQTTIKA